MWLLNREDGETTVLLESISLIVHTHLHRVRSKPVLIMAQGLHKIDPLVFDENIADNWTKFKREWHIYSSNCISASVHFSQPLMLTLTFEEGKIHRLQSYC